jgi:hypothetical protein
VKTQPSSWFTNIAFTLSACATNESTHFLSEIRQALTVLS